MDYYLAINTEVVFPENRGRSSFKFKTVNSFKVDGDWRNLTGTAEIVLAKRLFFDEKGKVFELIKAGDPIVLRGGYNGEYYDEFKGFVAEILDDMPVVLKCEDNMYLLKRTPVNKSYSSVKLENLLKDICPGQFSINAMDVELGSLLLRNTTVTEVLQMLKDDYGIYSYFDGDTLVSGKVFTDNTQVVKYSFDEGRKNIISNNLKYHTKDMIKIKVTMTSHNKNGKKITVTVGDKDGQEQRLVCTNIENKAALEALAKKELDRLKYDGYQGSFEAFAKPFVKHGYTASLINREFPERAGDYYVDAVSTSLTDQGKYHRIVTLGAKAAKQ